jgi:NAD+ diphosphatase
MNQPGRHLTGCVAAPVTDDALCFVFVGRSMLVKANGVPGVSIPRPADLRELRRAPADRAYVGRFEGAPCWAVDFVEIADLPAGLALRDLRPLLDELPADQAALASRAAQLLHWRRTHRRCGHCGGPTHDAREGGGRRCRRCGLTVFPHLSPAIIVAVVREGRLLLARGSRFPDGFYSVLAGFVEPGETLEACVRREVREEVGIEIDDLRYFGSQAWPFPDSLMIAFTAQHAGGEICADGEEILEARWVGPDELPRVPSRASIARRLIDWFVAEHGGASGQGSQRRS